MQMYTVLGLVRRLVVVSRRQGCQVWMSIGRQNVAIQTFQSFSTSQVLACVVSATDEKAENAQGQRFPLRGEAGEVPASPAEPHRTLNPRMLRLIGFIDVGARLNRLAAPASAHEDTWKECETLRTLHMLR